ncbi:MULTISPECIES: hypothetical protein [unclassified Pseudomonas]|uniref:Uncharacterized protein n=1 Tax=Pseudomonas sp. MYb327 TaxID=2745230 RepID=A0AAU8E1D5_9PSED
MNTKDTITNIANEAVDQLEVASEYLAWFDSLSFAISSSLKNGHENHAVKLASIAQYLASDYRSIVEQDVKTFNDRLIVNRVRG